MCGRGINHEQKHNLKGQSLLQRGKRSNHLSTNFDNYEYDFRCPETGSVTKFILGCQEWLALGSYDVFLAAHPRQAPT